MLKPHQNNLDINYFITEENWKLKFEEGEEVKNAATITGVAQDAYDSLITLYKEHYKTIADKNIEDAAITDNTNYEELMQFAGEILGKISEECANSSCSFSPQINTTVLPSMGKCFDKCH